jgi:Rps23 Pro-64 3,4-dihydroxylase Tpa1-like proline 4-hydroxylase
MVWPRLDELGRDFLAARPFRHVVVDDFLEAGLCRNLIDEFPKFDQRNAVNEAGEAGRKAVHADLRTLGPAYRQFDALMRDTAFLKRTGALTGIADLLYDRHYIGGGTHENLHGQELDIHVDFNYHPITFRHRRLNLILFLNPEWSESWGGCLELCADPWNPGAEMVRILPLANRAVLFETTERSWHGFGRITLPPHKQVLSRRSIAVYFYTKQRPAEETASPHATVYIPKPLATHLQPEYTLTEFDVDELQRLTQRRDDEIRFLYEREIGYTRLIHGITNSFSFRLGRLLTWPARALRRR